MDRSTTARKDALPLDVQLRDLSASGCFVETTERFSIGDELDIGLAGAGVVRAKVVRVQRDGVGCSFVTPLGGDRLREAFQRATVVGLPASLPRAASPWRDIVEKSDRWPLPVRTMIFVVPAVVFWVVILRALF